MEIQKAFGKSLRTIRKEKKLSQEDFSEVSSRTYLSSLERGLKSPTLEKVDAIAGRLGVHPLTLITLTFLMQEKELSVEQLQSRVGKEIENFVI